MLQIEIENLNIPLRVVINPSLTNKINNEKFKLSLRTIK